MAYKPFAARGLTGVSPIYDGVLMGLDTRITKGTKDAVGRPVTVYLDERDIEFVITSLVDNATGRNAIVAGLRAWKETELAQDAAPVDRVNFPARRRQAVRQAVQTYLARVTLSQTLKRSAHDDRLHAQH